MAHLLSALNTSVVVSDTGEGRTLPGVDKKVIEVYQGYLTCFNAAVHFFIKS